MTGQDRKSHLNNLLPVSKMQHVMGWDTLGWELMVESTGEALMPGMIQGWTVSLQESLERTANLLQQDLGWVGDSTDLAPTYVDLSPGRLP